MRSHPPPEPRSAAVLLAIAVARAFVAVAAPAGADDPAAPGTAIGGDVSASTDPPLVGRGAADAAFRPGATAFAGQTLGLEIPAEVADADTFELRRHALGDARTGALVRQFELDGADRHRLSTTSLDGTFVVVPADDRSRAIRFDSDGVATDIVDASEVRPVEVTAQSLRVEWGQDRITTNDDDVDLEIRSNRGRYNLNVSADGLDYAELESLFREGGAADNPEPHADRQPFAVDGAVHDAHADDDVLVIRGLADGALTADFTGIDPGTYRFTFEVTDTGVTSGAPVGDENDDPPATEPDPAFFNLTDFDPETATVAPGEAITVSVTVTNIGGTEGTQVVELRIDDDPVAAEELTLDRDDGESVSLTADAPADPGAYAHSVHTANTSRTGSLTVAAPDTPTPDTPADTPEDTPADTPEDTPADTPEDTPVDTDDDTPGFGALVALVALVAAALLARRVTPA